MTFQQELTSFWPPKDKPTDPVPQIGAKAPSSELLPMPAADGRPTVVTFLRHCGCPFSEKTFKSLRTAAAGSPDIRFVAVSQGDQGTTERWLDAIGGGAGGLEIVVDPDRDLFARWGLGLSTLSHFLSFAGMWTAYRLGRDEGIWGRSTESGNRWQTSGSFAVDGEGTVKWGGAMRRADEVPDFEEAAETLKKATAKL
ncbi:hypothetical protein B0H11DRAFT_2152728 [Mycena galericulata]|nr:hypothetical protein B0H11DRAFT_1734703 [Mycena galericulata]KAJ7509831.1 hypothetical protein B0H11DRAFT_2152728 [Mycena galericulata]